MVNIDDVYKKVLAIMIKERRGELTPPHFNILAAKAQADIFEVTFHKYQLYKRGQLHVDDAVDDIEMLREKVKIWRKRTSNMFSVSANSFYGTLNIDDTDATPSIPYTGNLSLVHWVETLYKEGENSEIYEEIDYAEFMRLKNSPANSKIKPTLNRPVFAWHNANYITVLPTKSEARTIAGDWFQKPIDPKWVGQSDGTFFKRNASAATYKDFTLHPSEETTLVNKILELASVALGEPGLYNAASQDEAKLETNKDN